MKAIMKKSLAFVVTLALMLTVMLPCFTFVSTAAVVYDYDITDSASIATIADSFDVYYKASADATAYAQGDFATLFDTETMAGEAIIHKPAYAISGDYGRGKNTILYFKTALTNFEVSFKAQSEASGNNDVDCSAGPGVVFGVQDKTQWVQAVANNGYDAWNYGFGGGFFFIGGWQSDAWVDRLYGGHNGTWDPGFKNGRYFKVKVDDGAVSMAHSDDGATWTTYDFGFLPDSYAGGYVGIAFPGNATKLFDLEFVDLDGGVEEPTVPEESEAYTQTVYDYDIQDGLGLGMAEVANDFEVYYKASADATAYAQGEFATLFDTTSMPGEVILHNAPYETAGDFGRGKTTILYFKTELKNFEVTLKANSNPTNNDDYNKTAGPSIVFGVQDKTKWVTEAANNGYEAWNYGFGGGFFFVGGWNGDAYVDRLLADPSNGGFGWDPGFKSGRYFKLRVEDGAVTMSHSWDGENWTDRALGTLSEAYEGGYMGIAFPGNATRLWDLQVVDIDGKDILSKFDAYYKASAEDTAYGLGSTDTLFVKRDEGLIVHKAPYTTSGDYGRNKTTVLYYQTQLNNFQVTMKAKSTTTGDDDYNKSAGPSIVFGVKDRSQWVNAVADNGYEAWNYGFGGGFFFVGGWQAGEEESTYVDRLGGGHNGVWDPGFKGGRYFRVKVKNGMVTMAFSDDNSTWTTYDIVELPASYQGGYMGIALPGNGTNLWDIDVVDLDDESIPGVKVQSYDFSNEDKMFESYENAMVNFSTYFTANAASKTLEEANFADHFELGDSALVHIPAVDINAAEWGDYWALKDQYVTTLIDNTARYRDFAMVVKARGSADPSVNGGYGDWNGISFLFGVQTPTKWNSNGQGFVAGVNFNQNGGSTTTLTSYSKYAPAATTYTYDTQDFANYVGWKYDYTYIIIVRDNTLTIKAEWGNYNGVATYTLGEDYLGGNIGIKFISDAINVYAIDIYEVGGVVIDPVAELPGTGVYDFTYPAAQELAAQDFDAYYSNVAGDGVLEAVEFGDHFEFTETTMVHKFTEIIDTTNYASMFGSNVTTLMYNKEMLRNFEMTITAKGSRTTAENGGVGDWLKFGFILGNRTPTAWQTEGMGWEGSVDFNFEGGRSYVNAFPAAATVGGTVTANDGNNLLSGFWGYKHMMTIRVKVMGKTLTIDYIRTSNGETEPQATVTYNLGDYYVGGYVGLRFVSDATIVDQITITNLGGLIEEPGAPEYDLNGIYNFRYAEALTMISKDFDIYHSDNIQAEGGADLQKVEFGEYMDLNKVIPNVPESLTSQYQYHEIETMYRTTMVLNKRTYENFKLTIQYQSPESGGGTDYCYFLPLFGIEDPTKYHQQGGGYEAGLQFNLVNVDGSWTTDNKPFLHGQTSRDAAWQDITADSSDNLGGWHGAKYPTRMVLTVLNRKVTLTVTDHTDSTATMTFTLPDTYKGGYVGARLPASNSASTIFEFMVEDLGSSTEPEEVKGDFDGDGVLGDADVAAMSDILLKKEGTEYVEILDMNDDGQIDVIDGILLRKEIAAAAKAE